MNVASLLASRLSRPLRRVLAVFAPAMLALTGLAQPVINSPTTRFTAAESGRAFMTVGDVWNGSARVGDSTGDTLAVTYTNSGDATAFDLAVSVTLPSGFNYVPGTASVSTDVATPGLSVTANQVGSLLTFTLTLAGLAYDLPSGVAITLSYGLRTASTVVSGTYQPSYSFDYSLADGDVLVGAATAQQNILVKAGDTTIDITPNQQLRAVGETAVFSVTVTNTGLGGIFDVTIDESTIYPVGNNLQFVSLSQTAPALSATASNGGSVLSLPYLAPGQSFTANVNALVLSCGGIVNTATSVHLGDALPVSDSAPVQLDLRQPLVAYTAPAVALDYNVPTTVSIPISNSGLGSAYNFKLQSTLPALPLTVSSVAADWSYDPATGLFAYTANGGTIANGGSLTLSFDVTPVNVCSASGAGTVNYVANYANGCGDNYTIPLRTQTITAAADTPSINLSHQVSASRIAVLDSGYYALTLSAANSANIAGTELIVTDTLPAALTYLANTPSAGSVSVVGQVITWTVPKASLTSSQSLQIDFSVINEPCNAGTQPTATATTAGTTTQGCPLSASAAATFLISNNPGLTASQYFNVTPAPDGVYETGQASVDLVRDAGEGEQIPFVANYTFGPAYPGTWSGSTYVDAFGGVTDMALVSGSLTVSLDGAAPVSVPGGSVTALAPGFRIDLGFLEGAGFFNNANVAGHSVTFAYRTTAPDSAVNPGSTRTVTQITTFHLAGAGTGTSGGCNTPTQSTFTQGAFYTLGRAAATLNVGLSSILEVCRDEVLTLTVGNGNAQHAGNLLVTLLNGSAFTYDTTFTPVYGGAFNAGNIVYAPNGGTNPAFTYAGTLASPGTIQVRIRRRATGDTNATGFSAKVDYDSWQTAAAGLRAYSSTTSYTPSSVRKANLAVNVTPGSLTVTSPTVSYVTYVSNTDAGTAFGAVLANTLPPGITIDTTATDAANPGYPVTVNGQDLSWALGDMASGATIPITLVAHVGIIPGCSLTITTERITATWGCDATPFTTVTKVPPSFVFPSGKMQVVHDSTQTVARLCDLGKIVVVVKNTGPTNIAGVTVRDVVPPSAGFSINGTVQYRLNGGALQNALAAPTGDGSAGNPYTWTSTQIPALAELVPVGTAGTNQVTIEFNLAATEVLASQSPVLSASADATISCGGTVSSPAQPFTIGVIRPSITVTKTGRNISADPAAAFATTVHGGYQDQVEWKIVVANDGSAAATNVRFSDALSGSGGTALINGPGLAADTVYAADQVLSLPDLGTSASGTYIISEVLGNNCLTASRAARVTWGCTDNGATVHSNVSTPGSPIGAATIAMTPIIVSGAELNQTITPLPGGRARVTVTFANSGGTAYDPVVTATIPAGATFDSTGPVSITSDNASLTAVTTGGTATSPIFTFTGGVPPLHLRYGQTATITYYIRPTVFDTQTATTFPNLASPESTGNGLDSAPAATANLVARLDYTNSCGAAASQTNNIAYDPLTPDLDINLAYPGDVLLTNNSAANYVFTITNNGDAGSVADFITIDLPGLGAGWTINSITLTTPGSGGTGGSTSVDGATPFTSSQVGTLASGQSAVVTVNASYSGTPGSLSLVLRARGEARGHDGTTVYGNYSLDQAGRRIVGVILTKTLLSTSEGATAGTNVLIGEEATFRLNVSFFGIEGDITNLLIRDTPANSSGSSTGLAFVSQTPTGSNAIITTVTAPTPVTAPADSAASRVDFSLATLTAAAVNAGSNIFETDITFRVLNVVGNTDSLTLPNNLGVSFSYLGQTFASNNANDGLSGATTSAGLHAATSLSVRRPAPAIAKTVRNVTLGGAFAANAPGQAGDDVEYRIIVTNPIGAERPLYDLSVTDVLPAKVDLSSSNVGADTNGTPTSIEVANTAGTSGLGSTLVFNQTNTAVPTAGANFTRLDPGQTITLLYRGTLAATVTPTEVLTNNASVRGYSLPLPNGSQTSPVGTENTSTGPTRYDVTATAATVTIDNIAQTKSIVTTSDSSSTGNLVFVGEQIQYRLTVQLPQGTIPDLVIRDSLPSGLSLVSTPVVTIGSAIGSSAQPTITPAVPGNGNPLVVQWAFGLRTVATDTPANRTVTIDYTAQVRNVAANVAGTAIANNASFSFTGTAGAFTAITPITVTVQAPAVAVVRTVRNFTRNPAGAFVGSVASNATDAPDAGDIMEYQVVITNPTAANRSAAFDLAISETIPTGMSYVAGSANITTATTVTGPGVGLFAPDVSGQTLTWGLNQASPVNIDLGVNGNLTFRYRVTVDDSSKPVQTYTNAVVVDWTSLNGDPATNPILGVALLAPGNVLGERNFSGTPAYRLSAGVNVITRNFTAVAKLKSGDTLPISAPAAGFRIGDLVTYTVTATTQEGTLTPFKMIDVLPAGMAYVNTVSILPATGTAPYTYTTPVAGLTAPSPGDTGTLTWNFGTLVNTGDNLANNTLTLVYTARVLSTGGVAVPAVSPATTTTALANSATSSYQNAAAGTLTTAASVASINAEQPRLTIAKAIVSPAIDSLGNYLRRPGDTASFQVTVTNNGTAPAFNIRLTDTLPAGMRATAPVLTAATLNGVDVLATLTPATWTAGTGAYLFDLADSEPLLPSQTLVVTYTVTIDNDNALKGTSLTTSATLSQFFSKPSIDAVERRQYSAVGPATATIAVGLEISGSVYHDLQPNNAKGVTEDWTGVTKPTVYANLVTTGGGPVVYSSVAVAPGTGTFVFTGVPAGTYNIVVTGSNSATTASRPANWLFQAPATGTINAVINSTTGDVTNQDFGLNQGSYVAPLISKVKSGDTLPTTAPVSGFRIGDLVVYTIDINPQEGSLTSFTVTDVLPAGLAFDSSIAPTYTQVSGSARYTYTAPVVGTTAPANNATGTLTWTFGNFTNAVSGPIDNSTPASIAANNTLRITYRARVINTGTGNLTAPGVSPALTTSTLVNSATVGYTNPAPAAGPVTAGPVTSTIDVAQPRLTVAKTLLTPTLNRMAPGSTGQFQVTIANDGTGPACNIRLTDTLPTGMRGTAPTLVSTTLNGSAATITPAWTAGTGTYVFDLSDVQILQPGQVLIAIYNFTIDAGATRGATLTNSAIVNQFFSKASSDLTQRRQYAALPAATSSVVVGIQISGSVYGDLQPNNAKDAGENWVGATKPTVYVNLLNGGSVYASSTIAPGAGTFSFNNLPAGTYDLILTDGPTSTTPNRPANWPFQFPAAGTRALTLAAADFADQDFGLYLGTFAGPVVSKSKAGDTLNPSGFRIGDLVTFTVDVQPQEGDLTSFVVTDVLPAGLTFESTTSIGQVSGAGRFTYINPTGVNAPANGATGTVTWNFGSFSNAPGGPTNNTLRIVYTARIVNGGGLAAPAVSPASTTIARVNSANVSYTNPAPISAPVSAGPVTATIDVAQPRLTVSKVLATPALNRMAPGAAGTFTVTVLNNGTAPAYNLTLTDTFPVGLRDTAPTVTAATLNGSPVTLSPVWTAADGSYVFTLSDIQPVNAGASLVVTYSFAVDSTATRAATLSNAATITEYFSKASADIIERRRYAPALAASASLVVGLQVSGSVYQDLQPNNLKDAGEDWTGAPSIYVNLVNTTSNTVTASATVNAGTGDFAFTNQPAGTYKLIVAMSSSAVVASRPANWPFQTPSDGTLTLGAVSNDTLLQNFGLHQGTLVSPKVTKSHSLGTLPLDTPANGYRVGDLVTYTVDVEPQEGALTSFQVTDELPAGLTFVSTVSIAQVSGASRFTYAAPTEPTAGATGTLTWNFGAFANALNGPADNTLRIVYTARVIDFGTGSIANPGSSPASTTTILDNSAALAYVDPSAVAVSFGPSISSLNVEQPRLTLSKIRLAPVANNIVGQGETASFRVTVTNNGTAPAYNVSLKELIPAGMRETAPVLTAASLNGASILSSLNAPGWNSGAGAWTFALLDAQFNSGGQIQHILPGQTLGLDYTVTLDASAPKGSTLTTTATIEAYCSKPITDLTHRRTYSVVGPVTASLIVGLSIDGFVYDDLTPNSVRDSFENWTTGTPLYINVVDTGTGSVVASTSVPIGTGAYSFSHLAPATYRLVVAAAPGNATAAAPATWLFRAPFDGTRPITLSNSDLATQNFGLFRGRTLTGRVFRDTGLGGGTANDGRSNGAEPGLGNVTVRLLSATLVELSTARTDGAGNFSLSIPVDTATGATLFVAETNPSVHVSTGGYRGTTGGTYDRSTDRLTFTYAGDDPTGVEFGDVPEDGLLTDGAQVILPGTTAYYRHTYTGGTAGNVTFTAASVATPVAPWTNVIVRDLNGNGQVDSGEPIVNGAPLAVTAGDELHLIVKCNSPSGIASGARDTITITSVFTAANASPAITFTRARQDVTTIGTPTTAGLQLVKAVDKTTANPGDVITYTITYTNAGAEALSVIMVEDRTPAYTTFVSASAGALPLSLTGVSIVSPAVDAAGSINWNFTGILQPGSTGTVTFHVKVQL